MVLGPSFRLWGVDGVKDGKLFKKIAYTHIFFEVPGAKSRLLRKISKFWSTVLCIRVLRAIMPIFIKIGLILSKGGEDRFFHVGILSLFRDLTQFETLYLDTEKRHQKFGQQFSV